MTTMNLILAFFGNYQIELMTFLLLGSLLFRYFAYRGAKTDTLYYTTFAREIEIQIEKSKEENIKIENIENYLNDMFEHIQKKLPSRTLRLGKKNSEDNRGMPTSVSVKDYLANKQGIIYDLQNELNVFQIKSPPSFSELAKRLFGQDRKWNNLFGVIPIESVSRMIDIMPGMFIILGVFGTFIGIGMALPEIANIDFKNIESSSEIMSKFVGSISFSMNTSIAGIFYSLILTVLNTLYPIKDKRNIVFKKVESCLEVLWYHVQKDSSSEKSLEIAVGELVLKISNLIQTLTPQIMDGTLIHIKDKKKGAF